MSMTKREFDDEFNAQNNQQQSDNAQDWEGYQEYLYRQYAFPDFIEDMYEFFKKENIQTQKDTELPPEKPVVARNEAKPPMTAIDEIWNATERLRNRGNK